MCDDSDTALSSDHLSVWVVESQGRRDVFMLAHALLNPYRMIVLPLDLAPDSTLASHSSLRETSLYGFRWAQGSSNLHPWCFRVLYKYLNELPVCWLEKVDFRRVRFTPAGWDSLRLGSTLGTWTVCESSVSKQIRNTPRFSEALALKQQLDAFERQVNTKLTVTKERKRVSNRQDQEKSSPGTQGDRTIRGRQPANKKARATRTAKASATPPVNWDDDSDDPDCGRTCNPSHPVPLSDEAPRTPLAICFGSGPPGSLGTPPSVGVTNPSHPVPPSSEAPRTPLADWQPLAAPATPPTAGEHLERSDAEPDAWVSAVMAHDCHDRLRLSRRRHRREQNGAKELKPCSVLKKTDKPYIDSVLEPGELDSIKKAGYMLYYEWRDTQYLAKYYPHYPNRYGCHVLKGSITKVNVGGESTGVESGDHSERPKDDAAVIRYIVDKYVYPDMQARAAVKSEIETDTTGTPGASSKEDHASKPPEALKENHAAIHAGWMDSALCQSDSAGSELLGFNDCVSDSAWE